MATMQENKQSQFEYTSIPRGSNINIKPVHCSKSSLPELPNNLNSQTIPLNKIEDKIQSIKVRKVESIAKVRKNLVDKSRKPSPD